MIKLIIQIAISFSKIILYINPEYAYPYHDMCHCDTFYINYVFFLVGLS